MQPLLEVEGLVTGYGGTEVVRGVSFALAADERLGLFGPNGHGKTTLLMALSGLLPVWRGAIRFDGIDITVKTAEAIIELGLVQVPQGNQLFPELSVAETLWLGSYPKRARAAEKRNLEQVFALFPRLKERRQQSVKTLSGGERQMVAIGVGLMSQPRLLLLDEPTLGLAPKIKDELCSAIAEISQQGIPLLAVEQDVEFILALTDRLLLLDHGELAHELTAENRLEQSEIIQLYFGQGALP
ncbi:MAG: ABC transporter ATP-binding protein [Pseudomonadota bacterium]